MGRYLPSLAVLGLLGCAQVDVGVQLPTPAGLRIGDAATELGQPGGAVGELGDASDGESAAAPDASETAVTTDSTGPDDADIGPCVPVDCDDGNFCTDDGCDPVMGCSHAVNELPCGPDMVCSNKVCVGTWCKPGTDAPAPVTVPLPGESSACTALGIVACELDYPDGEDTYYCFDAAGKSVLQVPVSDVPKELPCSQAQLDAWVTAYHACWKLIPVKYLPDTPLTLLLDPKHLPSKVCTNIDGSEFRFQAACADHVYTEKPENDTGNFHGTYWSLRITPPSTATLLTGKYPFVACPGSCGVYFESGPKELTLSFNNLDLGDPEPFESQQVLDECAAQFAKASKCGGG